MNFLFLSKLLPLFFYPLGLACVLLVFTLLLFWKNPRWIPIPVSIALLVLLLGSNGWVSNFLVRSLEWQNLPNPNLPTAEAIVILGGATKSANAPRPMVDLSEESDRVIYAAKLYREQKAPLIIASGGRIDWKGSGAPESADIATLLEFFGIPQEAIVQEPDSLNTYENAVNTRQILASRGIKRVILVTSAMHMPRSLSIFKRQGIEAIPAPTDFLISERDFDELGNSTESILLNILPDAERLAKTTKALKEYIGIIVYRLKGWL
jgi:uncharacterized SAM-binding protein YcdF (DUF218 family)